MRIIAGVLGGRRIRAPRGADTRPTADRVRQALFDMLGDVGGARVLDLYAGTGALALEALSRGASAAVLVERSAAAARCIDDNAAGLGVAERVRVLRADALSAPARLAGERFDLVFMDPPWASAAAVAVRLLAALPPLLSPGARVVVEHDRRTAIAWPPPAQQAAAQPPTLVLYDHRRYGDTALSFYRMPTAPQDDRP